MKIFAVAAFICALISAIFGFAEKNLLLIFSSVSMCVGFVFLFYYSKNKAEKAMNAFAVCLAIYMILNLVRMFTEKGYF